METIGRFEGFRGSGLRAEEFRICRLRLGQDGRRTDAGDQRMRDERGQTEWDR